MTDDELRDELAEVLRHLAPNHECRRIWGRAAPGLDPDQPRPIVQFDPRSPGPAGNVWAADPVDIGDLLLPVVRRFADAQVATERERIAHELYRRAAGTNSAIWVEAAGIARGQP